LHKILQSNLNIYVSIFVSEWAMGCGAELTLVNYFFIFQPLFYLNETSGNLPIVMLSPAFSGINFAKRS
jgi:hypothetical protein